MKIPFFNPKKDDIKDETPTTTSVDISKPIQIPFATVAIIVDAIQNAEDGDYTQLGSLFDDIEAKDSHTMSELRKRKLAILKNEKQLIPPENPTDAELKAYEWLNDEVIKTNYFDKMLLNLCDAIGKGISNIEVMYNLENGLYKPVQYIHVPTWAFKYDMESSELKLLTKDHQELSLAKYKWIQHTSQAKTGTPFTSSLFRTLIWNYIFKRASEGDLTRYLETFGMPIRIGKYSGSTSDKEKETLLRAVSNIGADMSAIINENMNIEFVSSKSASDGTNQYLPWIEYLNKQISLAILGVTLTTSSGSVGSHSLGVVHNEVREELVKYDAKELEATINEFLKNVCEINFSNIRPPKFKFMFVKNIDKDVIASLKTAQDMGFKIKATWGYEVLGIPMPTEHDEIIETTSSNIKELNKQSSNNQDQLDTLGKIIAKLEKDNNPHIQAYEKEFNKLVDNSKDMDELERNILNLYDHMDINELASNLTKAGITANILGRSTTK